MGLDDRSIADGGEVGDFYRRSIMLGNGRFALLDNAPGSV